MYFVVAFSSSLDVAAIQMELQKPLDFDGKQPLLFLLTLFAPVSLFWFASTS